MSTIVIVCDVKGSLKYVIDGENYRGKYKAL